MSYPALDESGVDRDALIREYRAYKTLWAAVLWQAVSDVVRLGTAKRPHAQLIAQQTRTWLNDKQSVGIGSFIWICSVLDIDPERVRPRIFAMVENARRVGKMPRHLVMLAGEP